MEELHWDRTVPHCWGKLQPRECHAGQHLSTMGDDIRVIQLYVIYAVDMQCWHKVQVS